MFLLSYRLNFNFYYQNKGFYFSVVRYFNSNGNKVYANKLWK